VVVVSSSDGGGIGSSGSTDRYCQLTLLSLIVSLLIMY